MLVAYACGFLMFTRLAPVAQPGRIINRRQGRRQFTLVTPRQALVGPPKALAEKWLQRWMYNGRRQRRQNGNPGYNRWSPGSQSWREHRMQCCGGSPCASIAQEGRNVSQA